MKRQIIYSDIADVCDTHSVQSPREWDINQTQQQPPVKTLSLLRTLIVKVLWGHPNSVSAPTVNTQHRVRLVSWKDAMTLCIVSLFLMLQTSYEEWVMVDSWWTSSWFTLLWLDWGQLVLPPDQQIVLSTSSMGKGPFRAEMQALWQITGLIDLDVVVSFKCWLSFVPPINGTTKACYCSSLLCE